MRTDQELLREYALGRSEGAFEAVVGRHLDLVFATAFRGLNDLTAAQEITQNVFIALARKSPWLLSQTSLTGWLHKTTLLEVRHWWRGELRRRTREQTAAQLGTTMKDDDSLLTALRGELDEALLGLREPERQALMLRYFEGLSYRDIGQRLGAREDAVRMRTEKALGRLTQNFRRRGYAVPAVATTVAALGAATKAAPIGLATAVTRSVLAPGVVGGLSGLKVLLGRFLGLTRAQSMVLCVVLAGAPIIWEWNVNRLAVDRAMASQSRLEAVHGQEAQAAADLERLRAESSRLDSVLAETLQTQARYIAAAEKLDALKARERRLLTEPDYHWPEDLPYVRVPKTAVASMHLLAMVPGTFSPSGKLTDNALELLGITDEEKSPTEQALAGYWQGVEDLMAANAYETNLPAAQPGRLAKTVIVPPLGEPLRTLAQETRQQLTSVLGPEREQLLFGGWDQGAIQIFWPGNLWNIADNPQKFDLWIEPAPAGGQPRGAVGWHQGDMGMSSDFDIHGSLGGFPRAIATRFFAPWLDQFNTQTPTGFLGQPK